MNVSSGKLTLDRVVSELSRAVDHVYRDFEIWVARLSDTEKMFFIIMFVMLLFMLILVKAAKRPKEPSKGRSFVGSVLLVMVFAFGAGWMIDSRIELPFDVPNLF